MTFSLSEAPFSSVCTAEDDFMYFNIFRHDKQSTLTFHFVHYKALRKLLIASLWSLFNFDFSSTKKGQPSKIISFRTVARTIVEAVQRRNLSDSSKEVSVFVPGWLIKADDGAGDHEEMVADGNSPEPYQCWCGCRFRVDLLVHTANHLSTVAADTQYCTRFEMTCHVNFHLNEWNICYYVCFHGFLFSKFSFSACGDWRWLAITTYAAIRQIAFCKSHCCLENQ